MNFRLVQRGTSGTSDRDNRALVVCLLVGAHMDPSLRAALGPTACIVATELGKPAETLEQIRSFARTSAELPDGAPLVLVGFSLGCSGVRRFLLAGADPVAVVACDGTHASMPPDHDQQLAPWERFIARARRGEVLLALSHTFNTYVETVLRPPDGPYLATVSVLRLLTGLPLLQGGTVDTPRRSPDDGALFVYSYASGRCDGEAHAQQQRRALPFLLAEHVRPWLEHVGAGNGQVEPLPIPAPGPEDLEVLGQASPARSRGPAVVAWQRFLEREGFDPGRPDGIFGPRTDAATRRFQRVASLPETGIADAQTQLRATVWRSEPAAPAASPEGFAVALLEAARRDLGAREVWGENRGPMMRRVQQALHIPEGADYCAAGLTDWIHQAERATGLRARVEGSAVAQMFRAQCTAAKTFIERSVLTAAMLRPGMILVWTRGAWRGHVALIEYVDAAGLVHTIEANSGDGVYRRTRSLDDALLLGAGAVI